MKPRKDTCMGWKLPIYYHKNQYIKNPIKISLSITFIFLLTNCSPGCILPEVRTDPIAEYQIHVSTNSPITILFPLPISDGLVERIKLDKGEGNFSFVDTVYGRCVQLSTGKFINLKSTWIPKNDSESKIMTINLTTMIANETTEYHYDSAEIPNRSFWMNFPSTEFLEVTLYIWMHPRHRPTYMFSFDAKGSEVNTGWNNVTAIGNVIHEYVD